MAVSPRSLTFDLECDLDHGRALRLAGLSGPKTQYVDDNAIRHLGLDDSVLAVTTSLGVVIEGYFYIGMALLRSSAIVWRLAGYPSRQVHFSTCLNQ